MRISDWSSDVCSSDLKRTHRFSPHTRTAGHPTSRTACPTPCGLSPRSGAGRPRSWLSKPPTPPSAHTGSVRVDLGKGVRYRLVIVIVIVIAERPWRSEGRWVGKGGVSTGGYWG